MFIARTFVALMGAITLLHLSLLLAMLYWFVFTDHMPPFIEGRPIEDVVIGLSMTCIGTGFASWMVWDCWGKRQ